MEKDGDLHELLNRLPAAAPAADFEEEVWRRIRAGEGVAAPSGWFAAPSLGLRLAALLLAVVTGLLMAVALNPHISQSPASGLDLARAGTLTGDYLRQTGGG